MVFWLEWAVKQDGGLPLLTLKAVEILCEKKNENGDSYIYENERSSEVTQRTKRKNGLRSDLQYDVRRT